MRSRPSGSRGSSSAPTWCPATRTSPTSCAGASTRRKLALLCFSSGNVSADPDRREALLETHVAHARFAKALGSPFLQVTSERPKGRPPTADEYDRLGRLLTEIGRRTLDVGVRLVYHNHMGGFGESPDEVARVLDAADRHYVGPSPRRGPLRTGRGRPGGAPSRATRTVSRSSTSRTCGARPPRRATPSGRRTSSWSSAAAASTSPG